MFRPNCLSRHPSHAILRTSLNRNRFRAIIRLGSTTTKEAWNRRRARPLNNEQLNRVIEINSVQGVKNSSNKLLMKQCFTTAGIRTADWYSYNTHEYIFNLLNSEGIERSQLPYPIIAKHIYGSRGTGNTKLDTQAALEAWMRGKNLNNYIFEKFYNYTREYRLHVSKNGCFYTCRKMLRRDAPEANRWQRHDDNCVWILEENPNFDKPVNWNTIVEDCKNALTALNLDIAGFDVKVQSANDSRGRARNNPEYIIIESNSACSFGQVTSEKYINELNILLTDKYERNVR